MKRLLYFTIFAGSMISNVNAQGKSSFSATGDWRAVFQSASGDEIPIIFDIHSVKDGSLKAFFHNAEERFESGLIRQTADSLFILLDPFDNELAFRITDDSLTGVLKRRDDKGEGLPVRAKRGLHDRFKASGIKPEGNLTGTYDIVFQSEGGKTENAVGLFQQDGSKLRATFLRVTGDSRYLEGIVEGNQFFLSSFIGSGPAYYKGTFTADGRIGGQISGGHAGQGFSGTRNAGAALPDAYQLTRLREGYTTLDFSFPDVDGRQVSLQDNQYKGKVVVVAIGGTWCPNCMDEASFLAPWYTANHARGVEVISIQYERQTDTAYVRQVLSRFREKYHITYKQVIGGIADKQLVAQSLPALNTFLAFPTTVFIDRRGKVAEIHTGYSGPATGEYYRQFVREFNAKVDSLLAN